MIRAIAFVVSASAPQDPVQAIEDAILAMQPVAVHDGLPPHVAPFRSWTFTSDELEHYGVRTLGDALNLTPGVVVAPSGQIFIHGAPLGDGSVMLDGMSIMGVPVASVP